MKVDTLPILVTLLPHPCFKEVQYLRHPVSCGERGGEEERGEKEREGEEGRGREGRKRGEGERGGGEGRRRGEGRKRSPTSLKLQSHT